MHRVHSATCNSAAVEVESIFLLSYNLLAAKACPLSSDNLYAILNHRLREDPRARTMRAYLEGLQLEAAADSLVAVNVIEHIQDDQRFLRCAYRALVPGGTLLLFVPALPWLYGAMDRAFGHFRRYAKPDLARRVHEAGFRVELIRYMNFPGILSWFLRGRILQRKPIPPSNVRFYDGIVVPFMRRIEGIIKPPLGQSLLAIARKS